MSRIGSVISGLERQFLNRLQELNRAALDSAFRLATGERVPTPAYGPAAFVAISGLKQHQSNLEATRSQVTVAANIGAESQLVMDQARSFLESIRDSLLLDEELELTNDERAEEQATIDAAIDGLRELAGTEINGRRFLDGSVNYHFAGRNSAQIAAIEVHTLREQTFSGTVQSAATRSRATYTGASGNINSGAATFTLTGKRGVAVISVTNGESLTAVAASINQVSHDTGVFAEVSGNELTFTTVDFGDAAVLTIAATSGTFNTATVSTGADALVTINGRSVASNQIDGNRVRYTQNGAHVVFDFQADFAGAFDSVTVSDDSVAEFRLTTDFDAVSRLALPGIQPDLLGGVSGRLIDLYSGGDLADLGTNTSAALRVVDEALGQLTLIEARVNAFADVTVASSEALLDGFDTTVQDALDELNGVDEDEESLLISRNQALADNTIAGLALLQQQQNDVLDLVRLLAGL